MHGGYVPHLSLPEPACMCVCSGDDVYREWGWSMFRAFEMFCKVPTGGYTVLSSVEKVPTIPGDKMESFWLAETLK